MSDFKVAELSGPITKAMMETGVWKENCPIALERLREVFVSHCTFDNQVEKGSLVVLDVVAPYVEKIFQELFKKRFPIHSIVPIHVWNGDDDTSMDENNTSAFNFRSIAGMSKLSIHSYGVAIDVNPIQNPFVKSGQKHPDKKCSVVEVWPTEGWHFMNRLNFKPGMVEPIVNLFHQNGFRNWGGDWDTPIDLHHFEVFRNITEFLAVLSYEEGQRFFDQYVTCHENLNTINFIEEYKKSPSHVWQILAHHGQ
ncbi:MAG: M15 family metallopeptidase [Alphaproteobacteria bacterium]